MKLLKNVFKSKSNTIQKILEKNIETIDSQIIADIYNSIEIQNKLSTDLSRTIEIHHNNIQIDLLKIQRNLCENMHSQNIILKAMADKLSELR